MKFCLSLTYKLPSMVNAKDFAALFLFQFFFIFNLIQVEATDPEKMCYNNTERCYWIEYRSWKNYNEARQFCLSHGGDLAVMETKELWDFAISRFQFNVSDEITRIGLDNVNQEGVFRWMCRDPLQYDIWATIQPDGGSDENCVGIDENKLQDYPCHSKMSNTLCSTTERLNLEIGERHDAASFQMARDTCMAEGKHLLMIQNEQKDELLRNIISDEIWLGLENGEVFASFSWEDGTTITDHGWSSWVQNEPSILPLHDCAIRNTAGGWVAKVCTEQHPFYCEKQERRCDNRTGRCFWLSNSTDTWDQARTACQSECGDLAVIETEELWNFVQTQFQHNSFTWVGLTDSEVESVFRWLNGDILRYSRWGPIEPNSGVGENCGAIASNWLLDYPCNGLGSPTRTLCSTAAPKCTNTKDSCGSVPQESNDVILSHLHGPTTFSEARTTCQREGKSLLTIRDQNKEYQVNNHHQTSENIWIDLTDEVLESVFRWPDGYVTKWANWNYDVTNPSVPKEPNGREGENCAVRGINGRWFDVSCHSHYYFHCEEDVPDPTFLHGDFILQKSHTIDNADIIQTTLVVSKLRCATYCYRNKMCKAFSMADTKTCVIASELTQTQTQGDKKLFLVHKKF